MRYWNILIVFFCLCGSVSIDGYVLNASEPSSSDFYFVQITDTHVLHRIFDRQQLSKQRFSTVIDTVVSFDPKPAFIVMTGDLVEWGGIGLLGALNYQTLRECLYEQGGQLFADSMCTIPVYTTPGNHDYCFQRNLWNYHRLIDPNHICEEDRYMVISGDVSLFFMDSGPNYYADLSIVFDWHGQGFTDDDITWLDTELENCSSSHKIILMHHPAVGPLDDLFIKNRVEFVALCEQYQVDLVLTGHTHHAVVYDHELNEYTDACINCSVYPTLYVQTDDCKQGIHYRNISVVQNDVWLEECVEIEEGGSILLFSPNATREFR
jgi:predicted MPP superfamily phosphohydrolase